MREAIGQVLGGLDGIDVAAVCGDGDSLLEAVDREEPDVVVTDLRMPPAGDGEGSASRTGSARRTRRSAWSSSASSPSRTTEQR